MQVSELQLHACQSQQQVCDALKCPGLHAHYTGEVNKSRALRGFPFPLFEKGKEEERTLPGTNESLRAPGSKPFGALQCVQLTPAQKWVSFGNLMESLP